MSQTRLSDTTADAVRDRYRTLFAGAFAPQFRYEQMPGVEERPAYAAEFAAHHLGQIDKKLRRLIEIMERSIRGGTKVGSRGSLQKSYCQKRYLRELSDVLLRDFRA